MLSTYSHSPDIPLPASNPNYAAAGLHIGDAVFHDHGTKRDTGIEVAREIEVEDSAGVDAAASALQFLDDFHGADLRCTRNGAGRKTGHQRVKTIHVLAQASAETGNQMHDVRVALHGEQLFGLHRAVIADTAQIVAPEIDEHDVLGALFFTGKHFLFQALVAVSV